MIHLVKSLVTLNFLFWSADEPLLLELFCSLFSTATKRSSSFLCWNSILASILAAEIAGFLTNIAVAET